MAGAAWLWCCGPAPTSMQKGEVPGLDRCRKLPNHRRESHKHHQGQVWGGVHRKSAVWREQALRRGEGDHQSWLHPEAHAVREPTVASLLLFGLIPRGLVVGVIVFLFFWNESSRDSTKRGERAAAGSRCGTSGNARLSSRMTIQRLGPETICDWDPCSG